MSRSIGRVGIRWSWITYRVNRRRSIGRYCIGWSRISYRGILSRIIGRYGSRWIQIRYRVILSRRIGIDKCGGRIRFRGIFSRSIGIDSCGGVCIRFRDNRGRRVVREGNGNHWVRCRVNSCRNIFRNSSYCQKNCRGNSSSFGFLEQVQVQQE